MNDSNDQSTSSLELAEQRLLEPAGIGENELNQVLDRMLGHAVDGGDLYF